MDNNLSEQIKNIKGYKSAIKVAVFLVYTLGALFATLMFTNVIEDLFPQQPLMSFLAHAGAWANFVSVLLMLGAKDYWVHGKVMMTAAVIFWGTEVLMMIANTLSAYDSAWVGWWTDLAPATPVLVIIFWGVLWMMHPDHKTRQSTMDFYYTLQENLRGQMMSYVNSDEVRRQLQAGTIEIVSQFVDNEISNSIDATRVTNTEKPITNIGNPVPDSTERVSVSKNGGNGNGRPLP